MHGISIEARLYLSLLWARADLKYVKQVAWRSEIFTNNVILCAMYKAMLRAVLCANKCEIINFPWNENNVDQLFPISRIARMPTALVRPRNATQAESGGLSSLVKLTTFLHASKRVRAGLCRPVCRQKYTTKIIKKFKLAYLNFNNNCILTEISSTKNRKIWCKHIHPTRQLMLNYIMEHKLYIMLDWKI